MLTAEEVPEDAQLRMNAALKKGEMPHWKIKINLKTN